MCGKNPENHRGGKRGIVNMRNLNVLSEKLHRSVETHPMERYAGALGAALTSVRQTSVIM